MSQSDRASQMRRKVDSWPKTLTSMGRGARPSWGERLAASAITTQRREASQTSFSYSMAAPAPLISCSPGPISSAPSTVRSISTWFSSSRGMANTSARLRVAVEVGTPRTSSFSACIRPARARTNQAAVEPVPRPTIMPLSTSAAAASPAWRFCSSGKVVMRAL